MRHLFILVRNCLKSPILRESFQSSEILNAVMSSSLNVADTIENERWITLTDLYCDKLKDRMHDLLFRTFNIISTSKKEVKRYHVAALDLLTLIMKNDQTTHQFFIKTRIHEVLLNLMFQFPHHTFLHLSIVNHIKIAMTIPIIQNKIVTHLLEPVILEGSKSEATVLTGTSYAILNEALNLLKKNKWLVEELKKIPECEEFIKDEMIPRLNLIKNGYGGSY